MDISEILGEWLLLPEDETRLISPDGIVYFKELVDTMRQKYLTETHFGELEIPQGIRDIPPQLRHLYTMVIRSAPYGLGHTRIGDAIKEWAEVMGFNTVDHYISEAEHDPPTPKYSDFIQVMYRWFVMASLEKAVAKGMCPPDVFEGLSMPISESIFEKIAKGIHFAIGHKQMMEVSLGSASFDSSALTETLKKITRTLFTAEQAGFLRRLSDLYGPRVVNILMHPFFATVMPKSAIGLLAGTDSILIPDWYDKPHSPQFELYLETEVGADILRRFFNIHPGENDPFHPTGGFPAPLSAGNVMEFTKERHTEAENGTPPVIFIPASGIAPVQEYPIINTLNELQSQLSQNQVRILIQCGYGYMGEKLYQKISAFIQKLPAESRNNILLHLSHHPQDASRFFSLVSRSRAPLILMVKGSEMARLAHQLNIPLIATGAVGRHEIFNIYICLLNGLPVYMLPEVYDQYVDELKSVLSAEQFEQAKPLLKKIRIGQLSEGLERSITYYKEDKVVPARRTVAMELVETAVGIADKKHGPLPDLPPDSSGKNEAIKS